MKFVPIPREMLDEAHLEQRALERFKLPITLADRHEMIKQCQEERGVFIERRSKKVATWIVWWPSARRLVAVYYHNQRKSLLSIMRVDKNKLPASHRTSLGEKVAHDLRAAVGDETDDRQTPDTLEADHHVPAGPMDSP